MKRHIADKNEEERELSPEREMISGAEDSNWESPHRGDYSNILESTLPKISTTVSGDTLSLRSYEKNSKAKSTHGSLPEVRLSSIESPKITDAPQSYDSSDSVVNSNKSIKSSLEEDYKTILRIVSNLQNVAETISSKYENLVLNKSTRQLNFQSQNDIITAAKELAPNELIRSKKMHRLLNKSEPKHTDDLFINYRNKNRIESSDRDSALFFLESERLLDAKLNGISNIKWNDAISITSPCSTAPEIIFDSGKKTRSQNVIFPKRSVLKNGECNVLKKSSNSKRRIRYLQDIFTTLVDVKWRWTLVVFALSFIMSWLFYAVIYWLIAYAHDDFEHLEDENWRPCVENLFNFASCFLFSVETQHTIGYGGRATNEECPEAIFVMCIQSITGVMISAFMAGIFFAKMSRPKQRRQTLLFSRKAVICQRDAQLCLMFRVGDMRKSHIIGTNIRAHIFRTRTTREGEELPQYQCELQVSADGCESNLFFIWPLTVVHIIDKDSPLYTMSAQELLHEDFEVVAILEGTVESTGQTTQARTSYLPNEIKWGHRFESILSYNTERQCYEIDYRKFNNTIKVATPLCSAKDLDDFYMVQTEMCEYNLMTSDPDTDNQ